MKKMLGLQGLTELKYGDELFGHSELKKRIFTNNTMITNFEKETKALTREDRVIANSILTLLKSHHKKEEDAIKSDDLVSNYTKIGWRITGVRLRKIINYLRAVESVPVLATNKGYYYCEDFQQIKLQIQSLKEREIAISNARKGLQGLLLKTIFKESENVTFDKENDISYKVKFKHTDLGHIRILEDGFFYWFPPTFGKGVYIGKWVLNSITKKIDELNAPYYKMLEEKFK